MTTTLNASTAGAGGFIATSDNSGVLALQTAGTTAITIDASQRAAFVAGTAALPAITTAGDTNTGIFFPAADTIAFVEGGAEAMRINSSGYVGIGATVPEQRFQVQGATSQTRISVDSDGNSLQFWKDATPTFVGSVGLSTPGGADQSALVFSRYTGSWSESMRIDSSGNLLVNTTGLDGRFRVEQSGIVWARATNHTNSGTQYFDSFRYNGTAIGTITGNNSNVAYNTSSDYRLKENIAPMTGALAKVALLKPVTYKWKIDGSDGEGFIAHELAEVKPDCVSGGKDAIETYTDENGNEATRPVYQGIDTSFLVATLTAALQETKALIDTQAETINALTARIVALETA